MSEVFRAAKANDIMAAGHHEDILLLPQTGRTGVVVLHLHFDLRLLLLVTLVGDGGPHLEDAALLQGIADRRLPRQTEPQPGAVGGVLILNHELVMQHEDLGVDAAEVLVIEGEVVGLPAAETEETAALLESDGEVAGLATDHVENAEVDEFELLADLLDLHEEAAHLDEGLQVQDARLTDLQEGSRLSPEVPDIMLPVEFEDLGVLVFHRHLEGADGVHGGPPDFQTLLLHHAEGGEVAVAAADHEGVVLLGLEGRLPGLGLAAVALRGVLALEGGDIFLILTVGVGQVELILVKALLDPAHEFALDDGVGDAEGGEVLGGEFEEGGSVDAVGGCVSANLLKAGMSGCRWTNSSHCFTCSSFQQLGDTATTLSRAS